MNASWSKLDCAEVERLVPWFLDDELENVQVVGLEEHLGACSRCSGMLNRQAKLRVAVQEAGQRVVAPGRLRRNIKELLKEEKNEGLRRWNLVTVATAAAAVLLFAVWPLGEEAEQGEFKQFMAHHARNLPMDVAGTSVQEVKRYLGANLPFVPRVPVLKTKEPGFGGRVTRINNRDAAYMHYTLPRGRLSVFVYPGAQRLGGDRGAVQIMGGQKAHLQKIQGYTMVRWVRDGLVYSVVTDLSEPDLFGQEGYLHNLSWR